MKKNFMDKEQHKLPLIYKHVDVVKNKTREKKHLSITVSCEKYQTDFYVKPKPYKFMTRLL